ncbi:MAG TPA: exosortase/archaeosortase family protein [archaeon]|nr:exosortase/archaeosortase family protein [archaeon]
MSQKFSDKDAAQAGKFLAGTAVLFLLFNFLLSLVPLEWFEYFYASGTLAALKIFGLGGTIESGEPVLVFLDVFTVPLGFTYLCTGLLEMALVWASVLASFGIELRKRLIGFVAGTVALVLFNFFRIIASVLIIYFYGLDAGNFSHDLLFRVFLFLTVAGFYYCWFSWAAKVEGK